MEENYTKAKLIDYLWNSTIAITLVTAPDSIISASNRTLRELLDDFCIDNHTVNFTETFDITAAEWLKIREDLSEGIAYTVKHKQTKDHSGKTSLILKDTKQSSNILAIITINSNKSSCPYNYQKSDLFLSNHQGIIQWMPPHTQLAYPEISTNSSHVGCLFSGYSAKKDQTDPWQAIALQKEWAGEFPQSTPFPKQHTANSHLLPIQTTNGEFLGHLVLSSSTVKARGCDEQTRFLNRIQKASHIGPWSYNLSTREMWWSEITFEIFGYAPNTIIPTKEKLTTHIHPSDVNHFRETIQESHRDGKSFDFEFRFYRLGELRLGRVTGEAIHDKKGTPMLVEGFLSDITQHQIQKFETLIAWEKAREAEQLKNTFLANMSHELRTPLNAVIGFSDLLKTPLPCEKVLEYAEYINSSGINLLHFIDSILKISMLESRSEKPIRQSFHLNELLLEIKTNLRQKKTIQTEEDAAIEFQLNYKHPGDMIYADRKRIKRILSHLLENAIKFSNQGAVHCGYREDQNHIEFFVKDTGPGIPTATKQFVFDRFRQGDDSPSRIYGGIGSGLYLAKLETEIMGGKIWLEDNSPQGTIFYFTVPNCVNKNKKSTRVSFADNLYNWNDYTILIAEDQITNYKILAAYLRKTGANLLWAKNGEEAIRLCKETKSLHMVLMDINMPLINGWDATSSILRFRPQLPIIAQTAFAMPGDREKALSAGCQDYIAKPIKKKDLLDLLSKYLP